MNDVPKREWTLTDTMAHQVDQKGMKARVVLIWPFEIDSTWKNEKSSVRTLLGFFLSLLGLNTWHSASLTVGT